MYLRIEFWCSKVPVSERDVYTRRLIETASKINKYNPIMVYRDKHCTNWEVCIRSTHCDWLGYDGELTPFKPILRELLKLGCGVVHVSAGKRIKKI